MVAALLLHAGINFWPSIISVLPAGQEYRPYALIVAMLVLVALGLMTLSKDASSRKPQAK